MILILIYNTTNTSDNTTSNDNDANHATNTASTNTHAVGAP